MVSLVYRCTKDAFPNFEVIRRHPRGIGYETATHFIHMPGTDRGTFLISPGLTLTEKKNGTFRDWIEKHFAATDILEARLPEGHCVKNVWRPGLYFNNDILDAFGISQHEVRQAQTSLISLFRKLEEILNFIEPSSHGLLTFGHRTRELLILACTDVEDHWTRLLLQAGVTQQRFNTTDYVALKKAFHLQEFRISMPAYPEIPPTLPFANWNSSKPTISLEWYNAYNETKHDKTGHLSAATLKACFDAVAANIVMFCARFGPHFLIEGQGTTASYFNELFTVELDNPDLQSFYVPLLDCSKLGPGLTCGSTQEYFLPRVSLPLTL